MYPRLGRVQAGFHLTGLRKGSQRLSFVQEDWKVRVFVSSGPVDMPSEHLSVQTITMSGCMDRCSHYIEELGVGGDRGSIGGRLTSDMVVVSKQD